MEKLTLDFFNEKVIIEKPKDLSNLRIEISKKFHLNEIDSSEILLYYMKDNEKVYIAKDEDYSNFLNLNLSTLFLDVDKKSKLYLDHFTKIEEEMEKLIKRKEEIEQKKEEYLKSYNEKLSTLNRQLDILQAKKLDLVMSKKNKIKDYQEQLDNIEKKINSLTEKDESKQVLKSVPKNNYNILSFNKVKEALNNIVFKVNEITNEYIFRKTECPNKEDHSEEIENIKKIRKDAVDEINNLSKLVLNQTMDINENTEKKIILKAMPPRLGLSAGNEGLCEECIYKNEHRYDHLIINIEDSGTDERTYFGVKCKQCGNIIWEN